MFEVIQSQKDGPEGPEGLPDDAVILATGGATGITAEILKRVARPGMRLILVGRSAPVLENSETADLKASEDLRRHFVSETRRGGEYQTPAAIEMQIAETFRARERLANLTAIRAKGCSVEYASADMREEAPSKYALTSA